MLQSSKTAFCHLAATLTLSFYYEPEGNCTDALSCPALFPQAFASANGSVFDLGRILCRMNPLNYPGLGPKMALGVANN